MLYQQKYLNANCQKNTAHLQRNTPQSITIVPEAKEAPIENVQETKDIKLENEVYVNITVSGDLSSITGLLLPVANTENGSVEQLPYHVSIPDSAELVNTDGLLTAHEGLLVHKSSGSESSSITLVDESAVQSVHYELPDVMQECQRQDIGNETILQESDVTDMMHSDRTVWERDGSNQINSNQSVDSSVITGCESSLFDDINQSNKKIAKKKDYEKLAPYKFFCSLCSFKTKRESHYQRHMELHTKVSELFSCKKCDFTTIRLGHLRRHEMSHSDTKLACDMCHYHTDHHKFLLRHQRLKHINLEGRENATHKEVLRCVECGYSTTRPHLYQRHLQCHTSTDSSLLRDEHRFQCQQCSYKTGRKEHYIRHVNNVHNNKRPYLCDHCGKAFKRPDALKQHRVTHAELEPGLGTFRCPVCGKCCRAQAQLTQHLAVHSNVRSFLCEICGSSFKTRAVQRKHVLTIHKNPKAFSCSQCSRKFNTRYALRRHMKQHMSFEKRYKLIDVLDEPVVVELPGKTFSSLQSEPEGALRVLQSEPVLIQEAPRTTQVHDSQTAIAVQVIGFMPYSDT